MRLGHWIRKTAWIIGLIGVALPVAPVYAQDTPGDQAALIGRVLAAMRYDPGSLLNHYRRLIHLRNEHPALRTGTIQLVNSGHNSVYSFLRYGEDETMLMVINLSNDTVNDYALSADEGLLAGTPAADLLLGDGMITAPTLNEAGGFSDYVPLAALPPQSSLIIRLN